MYLKLRIFFTVVCALCLAVILPVLVWGGWLWTGIVGGVALLSFALMLLFKQSQEQSQEQTKKKETDFLPSKK